VVVLHGSTQSAANYDVGAGWSTLADRHGFALLMPEQTRKNNLNGSFSWFQRNDTQCGKGEAHSIVQMVEQIVRDHDIDRNRIFVTGLSAGGAMTLAMLASYPDVFAAGAVIAGLPYGGATNYLGRPASAYGVRTMSPGCRSTQMPLYFFNVQNGIVHHFDEAVIHHFQYQK
jgi:poly(hydroxyalkanoate) depolymerase family esterase